MKTTLNKYELKKLKACSDAYKTFIDANGDKTVTLSQALESNGWDDIWWFISEAYDQFTQDQKNQLQLLGCDWAENCLANFEKEFPNDDRPRKAIEAKRKYINGEISEEKLSAAWSVRSAAESAVSAAELAASAASSAAELAALSAARSAESAARSAWLAESAESVMSAMEDELNKLFLSWESKQ